MCARGTVPADLVIRRGHIINVFTEEILEADVAVKSGFIARVGDVSDIIGDKTKVVDAGGAYVAPAFIDAHIHIESSMLTLTEFAKVVIPHGTGAVITDVHELANVLGERAVHLVLEEAKKLPLDVYVMVPSCVPPLKNFETSGAELGPESVASLIDLPGVIGLGEMMNFPGVISADEEVLLKLRIAHKRGKIVDGHAPMLAGRELQAYVSAGILTDHESTTREEVLEKLRLGMFVMLREGSLSKTVHLLEEALRRGIPLDRVILVTDDKHPDDLLREGHLEPAIRRAVSLGLDPVKAIKLVTLNPAVAYGLTRTGAIAPGYKANLVLIRDLERITVTHVFLRGQLVAREGKLLVELGRSRYPEWAIRTVKVARIPRPEDFLIRVDREFAEVRCHVIGVIDGSPVTRHLVEKLRVVDGAVLADTSKDVLLAAVVERHKRTGNIGRGFVKGFGLRRGAVATTVAHDCHNIIVVGVDPGDMAVAVKRVIELSGGVVVARDGSVIAELPLQLAGLMSLEPAERVVMRLSRVKQAIRELGSRLKEPLMTLSFLALSVIPELKLTDKGLLDVREMRFISPVEKS